MNKSTLIAGVMAFVAFTSCHSGKSGDHGEDIHAGEEHVESGENKRKRRMPVRLCCLWRRQRLPEWLPK